MGASFVYAGGCVLNDAFDHEFDQKYNPERPIPSGEIKVLNSLDPRRFISFNRRIDYCLEWHHVLSLWSLVLLVL